MKEVGATLTKMTHSKLKVLGQSVLRVTVDVRFSRTTYHVSNPAYPAASQTSDGVALKTNASIKKECIRPAGYSLTTTW